MKQRILTGVIAGAVFIGLLVMGGYWYMGLVLLLAVVGYDEYLRMIDMKKNTFTRFIGFLGVIGLSVPWGHWDFTLNVESFVWLLLLAVLAITVMSKNKITIDHAALIFVGVLYLGFGFHYMISTRWMEPHGLYWTLLIFLCIWATDSGAYFSGNFLGKTLLWPSISPKKTMEGAVGGILLSVGVAVAFALYKPELLGIWRAVGLGVLIAVIGQLGDFIQSAYKRVKGIKDTGAILPGHGGVLDRVDSWLIVFPFLHLLSLIPH